MSITIKDIAREAGYAVGTVSRVLNNHPDVSQSAKVKIMEVVNKYNFQLNNNAKHLRQHTAKSVAVVIKGYGNILFASMVGQIQEDIQSRGYQCLIYYINESDNEIDFAIQVCKDRRPLGLLFLGSNTRYFAEKFDRISVPAVMVTNSGAELKFSNLSSVSTDDTLAAKEVMDYIIAMGHRNIAVLGGDLTKPKPALPRMEGCKQSFSNHNIDFDISTAYQPSKLTAEDGYNAMNILLDRKPDTTAVFSMSDMVAIGAIRAVKDRGLSVPQDISVAGFDGISIGDYLVPKLTTVMQNGAEIARRSVEILVKNMENNTGSTHEIIPFNLIKGESVKQI